MATATVETGIDTSAMFVNTADLKHAVSAVLATVSQDKSRNSHGRNALRHIHLIIDWDSVVLESTDGYRLTRVKLAMRNEPRAQRLEYLVEPEALKRAVQITGTDDLTHIWPDDGFIYVNGPQLVHFASQPYVSSDMLFPKETVNIGAFVGKAMQAALKTAIAADVPYVTLEVSGGRLSLEIPALDEETRKREARGDKKAADNPLHSAMAWQVDALMSDSTSSYRVAFNPRYLLDVVKAAGKEYIRVRLAAKRTSQSAALLSFHGNTPALSSVRVVLMPMMIP